jgi:hypothetical protein
MFPALAHNLKQGYNSLSSKLIYKSFGSIAVDDTMFLKSRASPIPGTYFRFG